MKYTCISFGACMVLSICAQPHHHYYSKRQKALITQYILKNTHKPPQKTDAHCAIETVIAYYKKQESQIPSGVQQTASTSAQNVKPEPVQPPRLKTVHDIIKLGKNRNLLPQDSTILLDIVSTYFNTHWEYTFYATWKKEYASTKETEALTKALIILARQYGKDTTYSFYHGYEPYSIAYLLESVCGLDHETINHLP